MDTVLQDADTDFNTAVQLLVSAAALQLPVHPHTQLFFLERHGPALVGTAPGVQVQILSLYASAGAPSHPVLRQAASVWLANPFDVEVSSPQDFIMSGQAVADLRLAPSTTAQKVADDLHSRLDTMTKHLASKAGRAAAAKGTPEALQRQKQAEVMVEFYSKGVQVWGRAAQALAAAEAAGDLVWPVDPQSHVAPWEAYIAAAPPLQLQQPPAAPSVTRAVTPDLDALEALQQEALSSMGVPMLDPAMAELLLEQAAAFDLGLVEGPGAGLDPSSMEEEGEVIDV
jgi:hypothetical protein